MYQPRIFSLNKIKNSFEAQSPTRERLFVQADFYELVTSWPAPADGAQLSRVMSKVPGGGGWQQQVDVAQGARRLLNEAASRLDAHHCTLDGRALCKHILNELLLCSDVPCLQDSVSKAYVEGNFNWLIEQGRYEDALKNFISISTRGKPTFPIAEMMDEDALSDRSFSLVGEIPNINPEHIVSYLSVVLNFGLCSGQTASAIYHQVVDCHSQNPLFLFELGQMYYYGIFVQKDHDKAFEYIKRAANINADTDAVFPYAVWLCGWMLESKVSDENNIKLAFIYYKRAYEAGSMQASNSIGKMYLRAINHYLNHVKEDPRAAAVVSAGYQSVGSDSEKKIYEAVYDEEDFCGYIERLNSNSIPTYYMEIEDKIIKKYLEPIKDYYPMAAGTLKETYLLRYERCAPTEKEQYRNKVKEMLRKQSEGGSDYGSANFALECEKDIIVGDPDFIQNFKTDGQDITLRDVLSFYDKALKQPSQSVGYNDEMKKWASFNYNRLVYQSTDITTSSARKSEAKTNLLNFFKTAVQASQITDDFHMPTYVRAARALRIVLERSVSARSDAKVIGNFDAFKYACSPYLDPSSARYSEQLEKAVSRCDELIN